MATGEKHGVKKQTKNQNQTQIKQRCWNYQTGNLQYLRLINESKQEWPRGATTTRPGSGAAAETSYPTFEVRGGSREELPHAGSQGRQLRGATQVQGAAAAQAQGGREELLYDQGQEERP